MPQSIEAQLFALRDASYAAFTSRLLPTVPKETVLGVRTPVLRKLAREITGSPEAESFLASLPHRWYEENNLHAFLLERIQDYDTCLTAVDCFLPWIDNWATCDSLSPTAFKKEPQRLLPAIEGWLHSSQTYIIRFAIGMLMRYFLDADFQPQYLDRVAQVKQTDYYVQMMAAWYFATALAKQYSQTLPYFQQQRLDIWVQNKAIQKALESKRITSEQKEMLRTLKRR